ncbi:MAG TPA: substrate-binding domain-containing protein, partial [Blastocatellia bacterium]|nr:substrate-binding domain-containing protein [Blastocatellia bacterium]
TNRSYLIGLIVPDLMHSYFAEVAKAVETIARPAGYEILICNTDEDPEKEVAEVTALQHRTDGLIISSAVAANKASVYRRMINEGAKLVLCDRHFDRLHCPMVITDNVKVGEIATEHLINLGHRRIGHLRGADVKVADDRLKGYQQALLKHKIRFDERLVRSHSFIESDGYEAMRAWIAEGNLPSAIFAVNDPVAFGAMSALHEAGIKVPAEVAIIGAGNIHYGDMLRVPLTTVTWDRTMMGQKAAQMLINMIEGTESRNGASQKVILDPAVLVRESCGAQKKNSVRLRRAK